MITVVEKVLEKRGKLQGNIAIVPVDRIMSHDQTTPIAIESFGYFDGQTLYKDKIAIFFDHICPPSFIDAANNQRMIKDFCKKYGISFYEGEGVCHTLMLENKFVNPWDIIVGGDSHTPVYGVNGAIGLGMGSTDIAACWKTGETWLQVPESILVKVEGDLPNGVYSKDISLKYVGELTASGALDKAIEFTGSTLRKMDVYRRMPIGLMATECSAVTEIFHNEENKLVPDKGARYISELFIDATDLEPLISCPPKPDNVKPVDEVAGKEVNQVFIGSCTNGTIHDLREAARIMKGRKTNPYTRTIIAPATLQIYKQATKEGLIEIFQSSGAMLLMPPGCGPCLGRHFGVLGKDEVCVSTSNRNYQGRMGDPTAKIYLASPATAAATSIEGKIANPRRYL